MKYKLYRIQHLTKQKLNFTFFSLINGPIVHKDIFNTLYHPAHSTRLAVGYSILGKKIIRLDIGNQLNPDFPDLGKLTLVIALAVAIKDWVVNSKLLSNENINN